MALPESAIILAEAQTMYTKLCTGDWLIWYTEQRWIGYTNAGVVHFSNHDPELCEAIWRAHQAWRRAEEHSARQPRFRTQADMVTALLTSLHQEGWSCRLEYNTTYGRVDVLATRGNRRAMIEVKLATDGHTLKEAFGQLLAYGFTAPGVELWIAVPAAIPSTFRTLFDHYNITIREVPCLTTAQEV